MPKVTFESRKLIVVIIAELLNIHKSSENADLHINNIHVENVTCDTGCGVYMDSGTATIENSYFGSSKGSYGAGIYTSNTVELSVYNTIFANNSVEYYGGGIYTTTNVDIEYCTFIQNSASEGGGIYYIGSSDYTSSIKQSIFTLNSAGNGGGIYLAGGTLLVQGVEFENNQAGNGGGIYNEGTLDLNEVIFQENAVSEQGAGFYTIRYPNSVNINAATFKNNQAQLDGGGFYCDQDVGILMSYAYFTLNEGRSGSAYFCGSCTITKSKVLIDPNNDATC